MGAERSGCSRMRIGLIDVDGHNFPNIPLMKLAAWHKQHGDTVEWYEPLFSGHMDRVYMSKVFGFTEDYPYFVDADEVIRGGSGYCIELTEGRERYIKERDKELHPEVEHIYPDYSIYPRLTHDKAFGFLTRGCPRGCEFCHVGCKEGRRSRKVADLSEFWKGQKNIVLCDPNTLACPEHMELLQQLKDSKARVNFNQGLDVRLMNEKNIELLKQIKLEGKATGEGRINRGKGSDEGSGTRSSLMWETIHIIENMGEWRPRYVIWENVKNVKSKYMRPNFDRYMVEV